MVYDKVASGLAYLKSKRPSLAKNLKFRNNKTYIMPTGFGWVFGTMCLILLSMAIGFGNNLLYLFVFLLSSLAISGARLTNNNVDSFQVIDVTSQGVFANQTNSISITTQSRNPQLILWNIEVQVGNKLIDATDVKLESIGENSLDQKSSLMWTPTQRGWHSSPRILIQSRFPFGMLRAWKYFESEKKWIVYPERKGQKEIPHLDGKHADNHQSLAQLAGLFRDYREFERSDSPQRIDWKRSLKHQKHFVKNFEASGEKKVLIDWKMTNTLTDFEDKLSQMSLWVDLCHSRNELYSLKINEIQTGYLAHAGHYKECMEKLALLKVEDIM